MWNYDYDYLPYDVWSCERHSIQSSHVGVELENTFTVTMRMDCRSLFLSGKDGLHPMYCISIVFKDL